MRFTGLELLCTLRRLAPETPILMTSGIDRREASADAFYAYDEWLPFSAPEIARQIHVQLQNAGTEGVAAVSE